LMFTSILLASQFRSKRFAEYFPPFAILFAAFSWRSFWEPRAAELPEEFRRDIQPYLDVGKMSEQQAMWNTVRQGTVWVLGIVLSIFFVLMLIGFHRFGFDVAGLVDNIRTNEPGD